MAGRGGGGGGGGGDGEKAKKMRVFMSKGIFFFALHGFFPQFMSWMWEIACRRRLETLLSSLSLALSFLRSSFDGI